MRNAPGAVAGTAQRRLRRTAVAAALFGAGVATGAVTAPFGHGRADQRVVIGQQLVRPSPPRGGDHTAPVPTPADPLTWGNAVVLDGSFAPTSVSCSTTSLCVVVDDHGQAFVYRNSTWSGPFDIDGTQPITSVSCTAPAFCMAVDQEGNAIAYSGGRWSTPRSIDTSTFRQLTSVSCASGSFCGAVDSNGNALIFDGKAWSAPVQVDPQGWSPTSRDLAGVSCPVPGTCVGIDPEGNAFYYINAAWQSASSAGGAPSAPTLKLENSISCATIVFCVATENPGATASYDGTQWSFPVVIDPLNFLSSVSCPSTTFCVAVDGLLPAGFNAGTGTGEVFSYNATAWSVARNIDGRGIIESVSCATPAFCLAVDKAGRVITGSLRHRPGPGT